MNWTIKIVVPEHFDGCDVVESKESVYEIPFEYFSDVFYVHRKNSLRRNSPYVITKSRVTGAWATNMVGVILDDNAHVGENEFDRLFTDRELAIERCLKLNSYRKVKIYGE